MDKLNDASIVKLHTSHKNTTHISNTRSTGTQVKLPIQGQLVKLKDNNSKQAEGLWIMQRSQLIRMMITAEELWKKIVEPNK